MRKSNLLKSSIMFMLMAVMLMATAFTAYAIDGGYPDDNGQVSLHNQNDNEQGNNDNQGEDEDNGGNETPINTPPNQPPQDEPIIQEPPMGSLVIINSTHDGQLLHGAVFAVYRTGENTRLAELVTDTTGRTMETHLPQGN